MTVIFVIVHDSGCEGHSAPIQAFSTLEEAVSVASLMSFNERFEIFSVPLWPTVQTTPWYNLDPVWPEK